MDFLDIDNLGTPSTISPYNVFTLPSMICEPTHAPEVDLEHEKFTDSIVTDGFCFKLAPTENPATFSKSVKNMAPKLADFAKGTTTLAFEF